MINQTGKLFIVALFLLMPCLAYALPGAHDPLTGGQGYTCNSCHTAGQTVGNTDTTYSTNACLICHKPGNAKTKKQFTANDFANIYIPTTVPQSSPMRTSHKWFGSDEVPGAGAGAPVDPRAGGLNRTGYAGNLACNRCHSVHGTSGVESNTAPYLRMVNDDDNMCRSCHAKRDTTDHKLGSHPVNISYTSVSAKAKIASGTLLATPLVNATNPTGQVKLINSKVVCSTCHGIHNSDSNTETLDNYTTGHSQNLTLTSSKGHLLRVNPYGATANAVNICTNCHAKKFAHNKTAQNVQCNDCHSGHVEYDAAAVANTPAATPNTNLVRRYLLYTTVGRINKRMFSNTTTSSSNYYNANGFGVCQSCHALPSTHFTTPTSGILLPVKYVCTNCHKHDEATGSFSVSLTDCTSCHGNPPVDVGTKAAGYTGVEETSPHKKHAGSGTNYSYICNQCHNGFDTAPTKHQDGIFNDGVFVTKVAVGAGGLYAGPGATYTTGTKTCSAVYCHSDGATTASVGAAPWSGTLTCNSCHATSPVTGSHSAHATRGYGCKTCHAGTLLTDSTVNVSGGKHVNSVKDVQFSGTAPATGATCSVVACHENGKGTIPVTTPVWGTPSTGACGTCHLTGTSAPLLATGTHTAHLNVIAGNDPAVECATCHTYTLVNAATHVDGNLTSQIKNVNCATNSCHGTIAAPAWGVSAATDSCSKCHGVPTASVTVANRHVIAPSLPAGSDTGNVSANLKTGAHQTHLVMSNGLSSFGTEDVRCENCHGTLTGKSISHADGGALPVFQGIAKTTTGGTYTTSYTAVTATCSVYCHNPASATGGTLNPLNVGTGITPTWADATYISNAPLKSVNNCNKCHKSPWDAGFTSSYDHGVLMTPTTICSGCHGHEGNASAIVGQQHMDGIKYGNGSCKTCHGYPPVASMAGIGTAGNFADAALATAGGGGYHTIHLLPTVTQADAWTPCLPCHPSGVTHNFGNGTVAAANINVFADADTDYRLDSTRTKRYNKTATATNRTCSNVSCHFVPSKAWY